MERESPSGKIESLSRFVEVFRSQFAIDVESIMSETRYRELEEWSSMQSLFIIAAIEETFGVALKEVDFKETVSVRDLFERIRNRKSDG